jgi:DNA-binding TFAR19-related protein (PDSD5 family)
VLTFETPQTYTTYLVELRFPSPNRGGFIVGLDDFYNENLVPGALISISRTDNDGHYTVKYVPADTTTAKLLELEDRRQRYVFRPATYACGVIEKPLEDKARRRLESVVAIAFERIARPLESGTGFAATFNELYAVTNIERPVTEAQLRNILDTDETGAFSRDPDVEDGYTYVPSTS